MQAEEEKARVIGAVVHGVAHVHQSVSISALDEDDFFERTGLRLSWPARVCLKRLLHEDVLLQDLRALIQEGALTFDGSIFELASASAQIASQRLELIAHAIDRVNPALPSLLAEARDLLKA